MNEPATDYDNQPLTRGENQEQNGRLLGKLTLEFLFSVLAGGAAFLVTVGIFISETRSLSDQIDQVLGKIDRERAQREQAIDELKEYVDTRSPYARAEAALRQWQQASTATDQRHDVAISKLEELAQNNRVWQVRVEEKLDRVEEKLDRALDAPSSSDYN